MHAGPRRGGRRVTPIPAVGNRRPHGHMARGSAADPGARALPLTKILPSLVPWLFGTTAAPLAKILPKGAAVPVAETQQSVLRAACCAGQHVQAARSAVVGRVPCPDQGSCGGDPAREREGACPSLHRHAAQLTM